MKNEQENNENENKDLNGVGDTDIEDCLPFFPVVNHNYKPDPPNDIKNKSKEKEMNIVEKNIPFLVKDILKLQIGTGEGYTKNFSAYGIMFETVTLYGNCFVNKAQKFILDDGTGSVLVKYSSKRNRTHSAINQLRIELDNQIQSANKIKKKSDIELNSSLNNLLTNIEKTTEVRETPYKNGTRVFVIGRPYFCKFASEIVIYANEIHVDDGQNRDKEIFFKRDLLRYYTTYFKIDDKEI